MRARAGIPSTFGVFATKAQTAKPTEPRVITSIEMMSRRVADAALFSGSESQATMLESDKRLSIEAKPARAKRIAPIRISGL
jgi:hypothetical protein